MQRIRSPIISVLGHVDHGKTTLLDKIRGTAVAKSEPGLITQYISASWVPLQVIQGVAGELLKKLGIELTIPGLLWIDLPGHAAFTTLRKRGGAIADLAVLVVDILEGFKPQTDESLMFLKQFKTPFILALTKIDRVPGWIPNPEKPFLETFEQQSERTREELEKRLYQIAGQLSSRGFESDRYDRVVDFRKQVAIVPVSGVTGEGIPDLLMVLAGIAQKFLLERLELKLGEGKGAVLEVKPFRGLGLTLDVILYDGEIRVGDWLVVGGREPVKSRVRAILLPKPLRELRAETAFQRVQEVQAAAGLKLAAPDIEKVVPGSPLRTVRKQEEVERAIKEVQAEVEEVEIETQKEGVILKADTLGSLEALIKCIKELGLPIRKAEVGNLTKSDLLELKPLPERICFCFGLKVPEELERLAEDLGVKLFSSQVIYTLVEEYEKWASERKRREEESLLKRLPRPARIRVLPGYVFRQSKPAIFGIEVMAGTLKVGSRLAKEGKILGEVREIQSEGKGLEEAKIGEKVAISMPDVVFGKDIQENDLLEVVIQPEELECLKGLKHKLREDELELICGSG